MIAVLAVEIQLSAEAGANLAIIPAPTAAQDLTEPARIIVLMAQRTAQAPAQSAPPSSGDAPVTATPAVATPEPAASAGQMVANGASKGGEPLATVASGASSFDVNSAGTSGEGKSREKSMDKPKEKPEVRPAGNPAIQTLVVASAVQVERLKGRLLVCTSQGTAGSAASRSTTTRPGADCSIQ